MSKFKVILSIETSCDETAAAILKEEDGRIQIVSNIVASSANIQSKYGGIIPEQAAREQIKSIIPVIKEAIYEAKVTTNEIDAIAVTEGPGLIGSLLVGVETAKVLAQAWDKPLIPINHLIGHFYANWIDDKESRVENLGSSKKQPRLQTLVTRHSQPSFPCLGLLVSGGHTDLVLFTDHNQFTYLGGTRDDAAGECFDKCARILGLPYPGGPHISKLAEKGDPRKFDLPRPMINSKDYDFSFSGLKTAVSNLFSEIRDTRYEISDLCASIEQAIIDVLVYKTIKAAKDTGVKQIIIAGGVAANAKLTSELKFKIKNLKLKIDLSVPPPILCTDNAAMIASAAFFNTKPIDPLKLQANPNLSLAY